MKTQEITTFITNSFRTLPKSAKIEKVTRISDRRYLIIVINTIKQRDIRYQFTVFQNPSGEYILEDTQFVVDFVPVYQQLASLDEESVTSLDSLVRESVQSRVPSTARLVRVDTDEPFFRFIYTVGSDRYEVEFLFDTVVRKVIVKNVIIEKSERVERV
jgi:hypothetical protein